MTNQGLMAARAAKKDEFYTRREDIEAELSYYPDAFRGCIVYCNCDSLDSQFAAYFADNFQRLGLRSLWVSGLCPGRVCWFYEMQVQGIWNRRALPCDGDFRSRACVRLLQQSDIVVTNPPFSLFRPYVALLMEHQKRFLILGNINAVTFREIIPHIRDGRIWLGGSIHSGDRMFYVPDDYDLYAAGCGIDAGGRKYIRVKGVRWFTNLDYPERHVPMVLTAVYHGREDQYPQYDAYPAIEVSKTAQIPKDYSGVMGVPITFIDRYCPEQFEILGDSRYHDGCETANDINYLNGRLTYRRLLIKRR